jgi:serine/threonine-protein kinase
MTEKIGKYRIVERIGRGGMGTVFKAHDPILNRQVALKVISGELGVTEEMRARFYREARACAKLSHPNIIVVYDLGEDEGRLFIVMELLEGEELKSIIGQRKSLSLETKLALMIQVCEGLHYAHERGIIHRDIKPGNVFVLRQGQVKILDFGIARVATSDPGLTKTGLIMGTLRYMSPEQARGRGDHRSDIFSVGAVFYELLAYRAAFDREHPLEVLEQLQQEEPTPLGQVDPTLPADVCAIVERALRKDPAQRFADLGQMRAELEAVQRRLEEEAEAARAGVQGQLAEVQALQALLEERLGESYDDATLPVVEVGAPLSTLRAVAGDLATRLGHLRERLGAADRLGPILERGLVALEAGDVEAAMRDLEQVVTDLPGHPRALRALDEARSRREALARAAEPAIRLAAPSPATATVPVEPLPELPRPAPARRRFGARELIAAAVLLLALGGGLTWMRRAAPPPPTSTVPATPGPRAEAPPPAPAPVPGPAPAAPSTISAPSPARSVAEEARAAAATRREEASQAGAEQIVPALWGPAASRHREADQALEREDFSAAAAGYRDAEGAYGRAATAARQAAGASQARSDAVSARRVAELAQGPRLAAGAFNRAAQAQREAEEAGQGLEFERAENLFRDAARRYRQAEVEARQAASLAERGRGEAARSELEAAQQAASAAAAARRDAEEAGASRHAARALLRGHEAEQAAQGALGQKEYAAAREGFKDAEAAYVQARREALEGAKREAALRDQLQQDTSRLQREMLRARAQAEQADAQRLAPQIWADAATKAEAAQAALGRKDYALAQQRFRDAQVDYQRAAREAREIALGAERQRELEQLRASTAQARAAAERADAKRLAPKAWAEAIAKETEAQAALGRREPAIARERLREARQEFQRAGQEAREAAEAERRQAAARAAPGPSDSTPAAAGPAAAPPAPTQPQPTQPGLLGTVRRAFQPSLEGVSGPVAWQVVGVRSETVPARQEVRWHYTLVLRETQGTAIQFERAVHAAGRGGNLRSQIREERFPRRLEARAELRLAASDGLAFGAGAGAEADLLRDGLTVWHRIYGKDDQGREIVVDIRFRL